MIDKMKLLLPVNLCELHRLEQRSNITSSTPLSHASLSQRIFRQPIQIILPLPPNTRVGRSVRLVFSAVNPDATIASRRSTQAIAPFAVRDVARGTTRPDVDFACVGGVRVRRYRWLFWEGEVGLSLCYDVRVGFRIDDRLR